MSLVTTMRVRGQNTLASGVLRRETLLQTEAVRAEFEGNPAECLVGLQQQPVDGLTEHRSGSPGPRFSLRHAVADDAEFVAVQLDGCQRADRQHPLAVVLVEQIFLAVALGQRRNQFGSEVGGVDVSRQRNTTVRRRLPTGFDTDIGHG